MQDRELVAAIVAGDPDGLAKAYDRYAAPLYTYCRFMLADAGPLDGAAQVVRDTFIIAAARPQELRDPDQLRSWLHAIARNECLHRPGSAAGRRSGGDTAGLAGRPDPDEAMPTVTLPPGLREQVLKACTDSTPAGRAYRVSVTHRAGPFGRAGFPKPIVAPGPPWWQEVRRHRHAAAVAAAIAAGILAAGIATLLIAGGSHPDRTSTVALGGGVPAAASDTAPGSASGSSSRGRKIVAVKSTPASPTPDATPTTSKGTTAGQPETSAPAPSSSSGSPSASPSPSPSPSPSTSPAQGYLLVAPTKLVLSAVKGKAASGKFAVEAFGGPVSEYTISVPADVATKVTVSPSSGSLPHTEDSVVVTVTVKSLAALDTNVTVQPGGVVVAVQFSIKA
jgi:DNA-directed RNA polymerase specialized sigma24 family protein